jgi:uncharacterized protein (DUF1015 family)
MVPDFFPFPGLRYRLGALNAELGDLTAPPYDVIDAEAQARLEATHSLNAVHLILPRDRQPGDRYQRAAGTFTEWRRQGVLAPDPPRFYLYRMSFIDDSGQQRRVSAVVGALALSAPGRGDVLPHERTMPKARSDRLDLLRAVRANLDPVWCLSLAPGLAADLEALGDAPTEGCIDDDGVEHCLTPIEDEARAEEVAAAVASSPLVIADGHHRYETALAYQDECRAAGVPPGPQDCIMTFVVELAEEQLWVRPIHRVFANAGGELRERLAQCFTLTPAGANTPDDVRRLSGEMDRAGAMGLVDGEGLALLTPRDDALGPDLARLPEDLRGVDAVRLDVALERIGRPADLDYRPDAVAVAGAVAKGTLGGAVLLRPVSVSQIQAVANAGERMPEKTTYFQPKPLTGLVFRALD